MSKSSFLPYARQSIHPRDIEEVAKALKEPWITRGPLVEAFEQAFAEECGAKYAVAFNSGTSALSAAFWAIDIQPYDRLFTTPNTFVGTLTGALQKGCQPVFIDIDPETGNMDLNQLQLNLNLPSSRGRDIIVPVHFAGVPVDMKKLDDIIRQPNTVVIEDAAHALGSTYVEGNKVGSCVRSQMTAFSFHPNKQITTGEGGMVTTNDEALWHRLKRIRNNGIEKEEAFIQEKGLPWFYEVQEITGNFNFTEFQAALGLSQLRRLGEFVEKRRRLRRCYQELVEGDSLFQLIHPSNFNHISYHLCVALIDFAKLGQTRATIMQKLAEGGIGSQVHYIPVYRHPYFARKSPDLKEYFPHTEAYYAKALSLPLHCEMEEADVERVVKTLKGLLFAL